MMTSIFALLLLLAPQTKQLIDNQRTTVWETTSQAPASANDDRVVVDLTRPGNAVFLKKGEAQKDQKHAVVVDIKDVNIPPVPNKTPYPLAFPREGVKKVLE